MQCKWKCKKEKNPWKTIWQFLLKVKILDWKNKNLPFLLKCGHTVAISQSSTKMYTLQYREIKTQVPKNVYIRRLGFNGKKVGVQYSECPLRERIKPRSWYIHDIHGL